MRANALPSPTPSITSAWATRSSFGGSTRLGRSLKDLIERAESLRNRGIGLRSLKEAIDTDSSTGQVVFHIFGALAEFERALIRERTQAGLAAARARGRLGGRRKRLDEPQRQHAVELYRSREHTLKDVERMGHPPPMERMGHPPSSGEMVA